MLNKEELGKAIEAARIKKGVSKAELARVFQVKPPSVQGWIKTGSISKPMLWQLIEYFSDVVGPEHWGLPQAANMPRGSKVTEPSARYGAMPLTQVPLISSVQAGQWSEIVDNYYPGDGEEYIKTSAKVSDSAFALRVEGDSMVNPTGGLPSIYPGMIVIVDPEVAAHNGDIVVAKLVDTQEATIKKLVIDGPNKYLMPLNYPKYDKIAINGNCRIVGVCKKAEFDL